MRATAARVAIRGMVNNLAMVNSLTDKIFPWWKVKAAMRPLRAAAGTDRVRAVCVRNPQASCPPCRSSPTRLARIKPSPTIAVTDQARELKAAGRDVIGLGAGEPDFDTPDNIKEAAIEAIHARRDQVHRRRRHARAEEGDRAPSSSARTGSTTTPTEITVGTGGKQVLYNALMATVEPGRRGDHPGALLGVAIPTWCCWPAARRSFVACPEQTGFKLRARGARGGDHAADQVADPQLAHRTRPAPPTPRPSCKALTDVLLRHPHVWVMTDDMYEHLVYDGFEFATPAQVEPQLYDAHADRATACPRPMR